ncbi:MAG: diacylglycerol kinase family lipid kinase [Nitrospiraceae bacterium]|nr:MAG: diacylglycerol kinase family lipid kinase [Nitrospiraceae bacterium]
MKSIKASLIINPVAGNRASLSINTIEDLLRGRGVDVNTFITQKRGDACAFAKEAPPLDIILAAGGDGTVNEVINGMLASGDKRQADVPLAILPLGTVNVLAKELGIPGDLDEAISRVLNGSLQRVSLGNINGRYFMLMAGIGFDGETVFGVNRGLAGKLSGRLAYIVSGLRVLMSYPLPAVTVTTPAGKKTGSTVIISNARSYGGHFQVAPGASITEPVLHVCLFQGRSRGALLRFILRVMRGTHLSAPDVNSFCVSECSVTSDEEVRIQIDGDYFGTLPARVTIARDVLRLIW